MTLLLLIYPNWQGYISNEISFSIITSLSGTERQLSLPVFIIADIAGASRVRFVVSTARQSVFLTEFLRLPDVLIS